LFFREKSLNAPKKEDHTHVAVSSTIGVKRQLAMEFTASKKDLLRLVARMQGVADRKSTMPVLSSVLMATDGKDGVRLTATDLYLGLQGRIAAEVSKPGSIAIPAKDLFERIKMMPDGATQVSTTEGASTTLKSKGSARRYTLRGMPGTDFPSLPKAEKTAATRKVSAQILKHLIDTTYFSINTDETRPNLNSALFEWEPNTIRVVTTDGHRLSKSEYKLTDTSAPGSMLIPQKAVIELRALCEEVLATEGANANFTITQQGPTAFFETGALTFNVKLVEAQFPNYAQVIPKNANILVTAPRDAFAASLRAVSIASSERTGGVKVSVSKGTMRITSESPDSGDGFDEIAVDYNGPNLTIGFNARYFLDVLGALTEESVEIALSGELDPAVVRPVLSEESKSLRSFLAVVMPMRI
jgi:DNA polymerase III subunit beta